MNNTTAVKPYYREIDICKGIAILLVVVGHALKLVNETNAPFQVILSVIYSFHMPLFFVLSGFVSVKVLQIEDSRSRLAYIKSRAARLLIPYAFMSLLYIPLKLKLSAYAVKPFALTDSWKILIGESPNVEMWFLYALFWVSVICLLVPGKRYHMILFVASAVLSAGLYILNIDFRIGKYLFFFVAGMLMRKRWDRFRELCGGFLLPAAVFVLFAAANVLLYLYQIPGLVFVTAVAGSVLTLALVVRMCSHGEQQKSLLALTGQYSMDIYMIADPVNIVLKIALYSVLKLPYVLCVVLFMVVGVPVSLGISRFIVRPVGLFRRLVLGMK